MFRAVPRMVRPEGIRNCLFPLRRAEISDVMCFCLKLLLWPPSALGTRTLSRVGHGCSGYRMLLEREGNYALGMAALVTVCSWNTNGIMVWAWLLW